MTPPHQREKEILEEIMSGEEASSSDYSYSVALVNPERIASYLYKLESRLDDLYSVLKPSQLLSIKENKNTTLE